jgi:hypothetical protein
MTLISLMMGDFMPRWDCSTRCWALASFVASNAALLTTAAPISSRLRILALPLNKAALWRLTICWRETVSAGASGGKLANMLRRGKNRRLFFHAPLYQLWM